jgi:hypothetical protein
MTNPTANLGSATYFAITPSASALTDVSQYHTTITPTYAAPRIDTTTMGNTTRNSISGYIENGYTVAGGWDTTVDGYYMGILGAGTPSAIVYGPGGSVTGKAKHSSNATCISYSPPSDRDAAVTFTAEFAVNGAVTRATF